MPAMIVAGCDNGNYYGRADWTDVKFETNGIKAVSFCNFGIQPFNAVYNDLKHLGIAGKQTVGDLWRQKNVAALAAGKDQLALNVPAHGVLLYKFTKVK